MKYKNDEKRRFYEQRQKERIAVLAQHQRNTSPVIHKAINVSVIITPHKFFEVLNRIQKQTKNKHMYKQKILQLYL